MRPSPGSPTHKLIRYHRKHLAFSLERRGLAQMKLHFSAEAALRRRHLLFRVGPGTPMNIHESQRVTRAQEPWQCVRDPSSVLGVSRPGWQVSTVCAKVGRRPGNPCGIPNARPV